MAIDQPKKELVLKDSEFRMFCELLREHCGLNFDEDSRYILEKRLARRVNELQVGSFSSYHYMLRCDASRDEELTRLVDDLTINSQFPK